MPSDKYPKPHPLTKIEDYSEGLRTLLGQGDKSHFNIVIAIENGLGLKLPEFSLVVRSQEKLGPIEAFTEFTPLRMIVRQDIYEAAYRDDFRSRFTLAHELGHLCLHWGHPAPKLAPSAQKFKDSPRNARIEMEANQFAGAFLMPRTVACRFDDPRLLASLCRVSEVAASRRLNELWVQGADFTTKSVRALFGVNGQKK